MEDHRWLILMIVGLSLALTLPAFLLRTWMTYKQLRPLGLDDLTVFVATLLYLAFVCCLVAACLNGFGAHTNDLHITTANFTDGGTANNGDVEEALRFWYICTLLHLFTGCFLRISIGLHVDRKLLERPSYSARKRYACLGTLAASLAVTLAMCGFLVFAQCRPLPAYWSRVRPAAAAHCADPRAVAAAWHAFTAFTALADAVMARYLVVDFRAGTPAWLQRGHVLLALVVAFSVVSIAASIAQSVSAARLRNTADLTAASTPFAICALLAPTAGFVAATLASMGPWLRSLDLDAPSVMDVTLWKGRRGGARVGCGGGEAGLGGLGSAAAERKGRCWRWCKGWVRWVRERAARTEVQEITPARGSRGGGLVLEELGGVQQVHLRPERCEHSR